MTWLTAAQLDAMADAIAAALSPTALMPYIPPARPFGIGTADTFGIRAEYRSREAVVDVGGGTPNDDGVIADATHRRLVALTTQLAAALAPHTVRLCDRTLERTAHPALVVAEARGATVVLVSATLRDFDAAGDHAGPPDHPARYREWTLPELQAGLDAHGVEPLFGGVLPDPDEAGATIGVIIACAHTPAVRAAGHAAGPDC